LGEHDRRFKLTASLLDARAFEIEQLGDGKSRLNKK